MSNSVEDEEDELPFGAPPPIAVNWCHSVCDLVKTEFEWTIHHYELRIGTRLESAEFSEVGGEIKKTWKLILEDRGILLDQNDHASGNSFVKSSQGLRVTTAFLDDKREKVLMKQFVLHKGTAMPIIVNSASSEIVLDKAYNLIVDGNLIIYCQIETCSDENNLKGRVQEADNDSVDHRDELDKDFEDLFKSMEFSDVTFNVSGQQFPAHKAILSARSRVFSAMFQHPMRERLTSVVNIPDIEPDVFKELLHYIYTGEVPSKRMEEVAAGLLAAADKYLLQSLKQACGDHLVKKMSPENCAKLFSLNENDSAYYLKEKALDYVRRFPAEVTATDVWKKANEEKAEWTVNVKIMLFESLVVQQSKAKEVKKPRE